MSTYKSIAQLKTAGHFLEYLQKLGIELPFDADVQAGADAPLAQPAMLQGRTIGNRFSVLPMEGWDGTAEGLPTELTRRRWQRFGLSGAKLIWGGEAVAVRHDGRANPRQLVLNAATADAIADLRQLLITTHEQHYHRSDDLYIGLQLTHSGRFARPNEQKRPEPRTLYRHTDCAGQHS